MRAWMLSLIATVGSGLAKDRPNVLFIAIDDLRPELGCYGAQHIISPNIDRLAKRGVLFERAYCQQPLCNPSRTSLMTGLRPETTGVTHNHAHFRARHPNIVTLPQHFKNQGYESHAIGKIYHGVFPEGASKTNWDTMGDPPSWSAPVIRFGPRYYYTKKGIAQAKTSFTRSYGEKDTAPDAWTQKLVSGPMTEAPEVADNVLYDGKVADAAIAALRELKAKPFFLGVGFIKPHTPFVAPKKYWDLYNSQTIKLAERGHLPRGAPVMAGHNSGELRRYTDQPKRDPFTEANARNLRHGYFACISFIDAQVGRVLDELDHLGLRENTIVLLYGDHGWHLGDHGMWGKLTNFETAARAPLIVSAPGMAAGRKTMALTEFLDIYPTLAELADLPVGNQLEGRSFASVLHDPACGHKPAAFTQQYRGKATGYSIRSERRRYTEWIEDGRVRARELYDYATDPDETINLAAQPQHAEFVRRLSRQLRSRLKLPPRFARVFGSHMVLQQGHPIPVWGTAKPEATVAVHLGTGKRTAVADADGQWKTEFPPLQSGSQPLQLTAKTEEGNVSLSDILVGEVWLCAGQSNIEWKLSLSSSAKAAIPAAAHARLRLFNFAGAARGGGEIYEPDVIERLATEHFCSGQWRRSTPESAAVFSAVGYFFGRKLLADLDAPVGLINIAMGGTPAEAWVRRDALAAHPQLALMARGNWLENKSLEPWCRQRGAYNLKRALAANEFIPGDDLGPNHSFKPAFMWDAAVSRLTRQPITGVLWYQGESNAESDWRVAQHYAVLKTLVTDWRAQWKLPELPFLFVQLPAMKRSHWPAFRASQQRVHDELPHTGMAVTIDLGHPTDVHPRDKQPVGERLALLAEKQVYGKSAIASGPVIKAVSLDGERLLLEFETADELATRDGKAPTGFEISDCNGQWRTVDAKIVDGKIEIQVHSRITSAVRYGWIPFPNPRLNLINASGLPAAPFARELRPTSRPQLNGVRPGQDCRGGADATSKVSPNALPGELGGGLLGPATISGGTSGTGVEYFPNADVHSIECLGGAFFSKPTHGDQPLGLEDFHHPPQVRIAHGHQGGQLGGGQLVGRAVPAAILHERQGAVVDNKMIGKKIIGRTEAFAEEPPQAASADLTASAGEALNRTLGMLARGLTDSSINADPFAHGVHFAKGHPRLRHAERARIHTEENHLFRRRTGQLQILLMSSPRVVERVVHVLHRLGECERIAGSTQLTGGADDFFDAHKYCRYPADKDVGSLGLL